MLLITSINITASSKIKKLEAYGSRTIRKCDIQALEIEYIDMHEQKPTNQSFVFGTYKVTIAAWAHGKDSDSYYEVNLVPPDYIWGLPKLEWLELHGCGIYYWTQFGDTSSGHQRTYVRIGNGIAEGTSLVSLNTWEDVQSATTNVYFNEEKLGGKTKDFYIDVSTGWGREPDRRLTIYPFG